MLALLMIAVACLLVTATNWQLRKFGEITYEQILFHLNISLDDEGKLFASFLQNTVMITFILLVVLYLLFGINWQNKKWNVIRKVVLLYKNKIAGLLLLFAIFFALWRLNIPEIIEDYRSSSVVSDFYEENYVYPQNVKITASSKPKNLILIFIESLEATFFKNNVEYMPEVAELAKKYINFSDTNEIGGFYQVDGTQWTQAGLVSQTCGIPLHLPIENHNKFLPRFGYLPKAWCLFDILQSKGYNQTFVTGMAKHYAGVDKFFSSHGKVRILDWSDWKDIYVLSDNDDKVRSKILRDDRLYIEAKKELIRLSTIDKPFAFVMMTMDTHFGDEYFDEKNCDAVYDERYKNVYGCASKKIGNFINWIKQQPFYNDTAIVVVGDHLVMNDTIFAEDEERRNLNIFINSSTKPYKSKERKFSSFDIYPTILESMGFDVEGDRLGLGVSLFGNKPTLIESGYDDMEKLDDALSMRSLTYEELLYGKKIGGK